ncbi:uncharacterized protein [Panulirus ornatus]|uniref:uncharacterized protein n=1 Tax=Panulirus ornatus TaxID=150431 RepID=UPI003A8A9F12
MAILRYTEAVRSSISVRHMRWRRRADVMEKRHQATELDESYRLCIRSSKTSFASRQREPPPTACDSLTVLYPGGVLCEGLQTGRCHLVYTQGTEGIPRRGTGLIDLPARRWPAAMPGDQ